jgi:NAD(P)H dehydrogenase (quinone)
VPGTAAPVSVLARELEKAKRFSDHGIKVFKGDYFDLESMINAFTGIDELLLIGAVSRSNRAPQHANMVKAIEAAKVGRVVYISLQRREHPKVKLFEVTDVENDTERDIKASGIAYTIARNTLYSEAYTAFFGTDDLATGGVHAFGPEGKTTYAAMADLAEANAKLLTDPRHRNRSYDLNAKQVAQLSRDGRSHRRGLGKPVPFVSTTREKVIERYISKGFPPEVAEYTAGFLNAVAEGDFGDGSSVLTDILGREPIPLLETFKGWAAANKAR